MKVESRGTTTQLWDDHRVGAYRWEVNGEGWLMKKEQLKGKKVFISSYDIIHTVCAGI